MFVVAGLILIGIFLFHSLGFLWVYRWSDTTIFTLLTRGAMAGFTGWFWLCLAVAILGANGWMILVWWSGVFFMPFIGIMMTVVFLKLHQISNWEIYGLGRLIAGTLLGLIIGVLLGAAQTLAFSLTHWWGLFIYGVIFAALGATSGLMAKDVELFTPKTDRILR